MFGSTRAPLALQIARIARGCAQPWPEGGGSGGAPAHFAAPATRKRKQNLPSHRDARLQRVEAVLFLSREPLNSRKIAQHANLQDGTEARTLIRLLNRLYDQEGRAFRVEEVAGGYQLLTRRKFASWLRRLAHVPNEIRLSGPALETLAVIAYRQPVLRADIEAIRGVNSGEILRLLMERDLVRIGGRSEELGRPYLYTTTRRFLQLFGLTALEDLPPTESLPALNLAPTSVQLTTSDYKSDNEARFQEKESDVSVSTLIDWPTDEQELTLRARQQVAQPRLEDDDDEFEDDELDDDDDDDLDDDEEDLDDDEEDDEDLDEDFDDEWEEVDDEDEDLDEEDEDEEDEDWDDDEDEDWDDDEDEEEEDGE
jgi:segregation and condensation protein B